MLIIDASIGQGRLFGDISNLKAFMRVFSPYSYSLAYNIGQRIDQPGLPFLPDGRLLAPGFGNRREGLSGRYRRNTTINTSSCNEGALIETEK